MAWPKGQPKPASVRAKISKTKLGRPLTRAHRRAVAAGIRRHHADVREKLARLAALEAEPRS